jgi:hypothetical protein
MNERSQIIQERLNSEDRKEAPVRITKEMKGQQKSKEK